MSDILDEADRAQEAFMRASMAAVAASEPAKGIGMCLNCGAEVQGDARWCDAECREDYEHVQTRRKVAAATAAAAEEGAQ